MESPPVFIWYSKYGRRIVLNQDQVDIDADGWWRPKKDIHYTDQQIAKAVAEWFEEGPDF